GGNLIGARPKPRPATGMLRRAFMQLGNRLKGLLLEKVPRPQHCSPPLASLGTGNDQCQRVATRICSSAGGRLAAFQLEKPARRSAASYSATVRLSPLGVVPSIIRANIAA